VATVVAITSGLAPGMLAVTEIVGMSILGSGETGRRRKAETPDRARPAASNVVAIGRRMKSSGMFMAADTPAAN
jgi:hypothetical protein